jgi:protein-disulfide isomerase
VRPGPAVSLLRMVYNCWYGTKQGVELIGTSADLRKVARGAFTLLILAALAATILIGCDAGSGGSSQQSAERQAPKKADSSEQKAEGPGPSGEQLGHPALGSADAPVVMTEFSDYQ